MKASSFFGRISQETLLLILFVFVFVSPLALLSQTITVYTYSAHVELQYRGKEMLETALGDLQVINRYLTEDGFRFSSQEPLDILFLTDHMAQKNIPVISIESFKGTIAVSSAEKLGGNNCEAAEQLCSGSSLSGASGGPGVQELGSGNRGCLSTNEHQSSWYYLNVETGGNLGFIIDPSLNNTDYDFAVWGPFTAATAGANCPPVSGPARCSYYNNGNQTGNTGLSGTFGAEGASEGAGGGGALNGFVADLPAIAGEVYILLVDNFSASGSAYSLSFSGSAVLGCTPVTLPVELSSFRAGQSGSANILQWTTESENNSAAFNVEWTVDPLSEEWRSIGETMAAGYSTQKLTYTMVHSSPDLTTVNYYRLVQTDLDGTKHIYSDRIAAVDNTKDTEMPVRIVNLMGQAVGKDTPGLVIYQFADGTTQKVIQ